MGEHERNRFSDSVLWLVVGVAILSLYLFVYPVALELFESAISRLDVPVLGHVMYFSVAPLRWLNRNVPAYASYIEVFDRIGSIRP